MRLVTFHIGRAPFPFVCAFLATLQGCGGGGGGSDPVVPPPPDNQPPVLANNCSTFGAQDGLRNNMLGAMDPDDPMGLIFTIDNPGAKGIAELVDPTTGEFTYTPNQQVSPGQIPTGTDIVTFTVTDGEATVTGDHTIIIDPRIMPLGDSITTGVETNQGPPPARIQPAESLRIGYRLRLRQLLADGNYVTDFVGSSKEFGTDIDALDDKDNEGHGGFTIEEIIGGSADEPEYPGLTGALNDNPADIVLLHIGTNDTANSTTGDIERLLNAINAWESANHPVMVLLALIVDQNNPAADPLVVTRFNDAVRKMAEDRISNNDDLLLIINQHDALDYSFDLLDVFHPTLSNDPAQPGGYEKMAQTWMDGLTLDGFEAPLSQAVDDFMTEVMGRCP